MKERDLIVIGGGVAGLTASIFAARLGLDTLLLERLMPGGQVINAETVEDFPGFPDGISGADLVAKIQEQAMKSGAEIVLSEVINIAPLGKSWKVTTHEGTRIAKSVIVAGGSSLKKLGVPGEEELTGSGVSYCATCDGAFFINQNVCVVGGGDSALEEALTLTEFASHVDVYCRDSSLHGQWVLQNRLMQEKKVSVHYDVEITEIHGTEMVNSVSLKSRTSGTTTLVNIDGVFVFVGLNPNTEYLTGTFELDSGRHIKTDSAMRTSSPGLLAAGEIRRNSASQLVTVSGDGATAALSAFNYVANGVWQEKQGS